MIQICILVGLSALASATPQSRGRALTFAGDYGEDSPAYFGGLEEFYNDPNNQIWLPHDQDGLKDMDEDLDFSYGDTDDSYYDGGNYDNGLKSREPSTFVTEGEYLELPEWIDFDFNELPVDKLELLNNATDLTDLAAILDLDQTAAAKLSAPRTNDSIQTESRSSGIVEKSYINPVFARCEPERVKVALPTTNNIRYLPGCVRLMRCGGCCNNDKLLSCQPTKSEILTLQVLQLSRTRRSIRGNGKGKRTPGNTGRSRSRRTAGNLLKLEQENHLECSCQCKVQRRHCKPVHSYNEATCSCDCKDKDKRRACKMNSSLQRWDEDTCSCECHTVKPCGNGEFFSQTTCQCEQVPKLSVGDV